MTANETIDKYAAGGLSEQDTVGYTYDASNDRVGETHEVQLANPNDPGAADLQSDTMTTDIVDNNNPTGYSQVLEQITRDATTGSLQSDLVFTLGLQVSTQASVTPGSGSSGTPLFLFSDSQGSTRLVLDGSLNIQGTYNYDAAGNAIGFNPATAVTDLLYNRRQTDPLTGQIFLRRRYYDLSTGRFTNSLNPLVGDLSNPLTLNKYAFGNDNPANYIDPYGNSAITNADFLAQMSTAF